MNKGRVIRGIRGKFEPGFPANPCDRRKGICCRWEQSRVAAERKHPSGKEETSTL